MADEVVINNSKRKKQYCYALNSTSNILFIVLVNIDEEATAISIPLECVSTTEALSKPPPQNVELKCLYPNGKTKVSYKDWIATAVLMDTLETRIINLIPNHITIIVPHEQ